MDVVVLPIDGTVEELIPRANLRDSDKVILAEISSPQRQLEWLISKVIVWGKLQQHVDYAPDGAPIVDGSSVSISHNQSFVAVLFSEQSQCGIDIENMSRDAAKIARKFTVDAEVDIARTVCPSNPELAIWCAKEALYKYSRVAGADFIREFKILSATKNTLVATAFGAQLSVHIELRGELLIAYC